MPLGLGLGLDKVSFILRGLRAKFRGDATMTAMLDGILRDLQADFVSNGTITAALETIKLLDADFSGEGILTSELADFDPDYQAVLDYATTEGYTLPSESQQDLQNQLVLDLKADGIWSKLDSFAVFATNADSDFALIDWIRLSQYTAINSPTFYTNEGFFNDGSTSYIDTNFNPNGYGGNYSLNSAHRSVWYDNTYGNKSNTILDGVTGAVENYFRIGNFNGHRINSNNNLDANFEFTNTNGLKSIIRTSSTDVSCYNNTTGTTLVQNSVSLYNESQKIYKLITSSSLVGQYLSKFYSMGGDIDSEITDYYNALNNYLIAI